ncbi:MAG: 2,3-diphosphoglycerate-dependent phosphoglycerate mutase [Candidatus Woesearchaeota archaeon]|nr:2,3-diphosphoglycerate-dependent phosphoglycerate mutase [Candidatus Woesearchaeota archaeon]
MKLVLIRHGESVWNKENRFTGWTDVELSENGVKEAKAAGRLLKKAGFSFDCAFSSYLVRALHTLDLVLRELKEEDIPTFISWRLNERHYGALQGLNKEETAKKYGDEQVHIWRRSYEIRPPPLTKNDKRYPGHDPLYKMLKKPPLTESLRDTVKRVIPYYRKNIVPMLRLKKHVIISAHGNSLRGLVKYLDRMSSKEIADFDIPTGKPLVYEFDQDLKIKRHFYVR